MFAPNAINIKKVAADGNFYRVKAMEIAKMIKKVGAIPKFRARKYSETATMCGLCFTIFLG
jgi:hypothetical protein